MEGAREKKEGREGGSAEERRKGREREGGREGGRRERWGGGAREGGRERGREGGPEGGREEGGSDEDEVEDLGGSRSRWEPIEAAADRSGPRWEPIDARREPIDVGGRSRLEPMRSTCEPSEIDRGIC